MENEFSKNRYITETKRAKLSKELTLTEAQVKTWFQNRRTKWRKEVKDERADHLIFNTQGSAGIHVPGLSFTDSSGGFGLHLNFKEVESSITAEAP